jgi:hypothetical protein
MQTAKLCTLVYEVKYKSGHTGETKLYVVWIWLTQFLVWIYEEKVEITLILKLLSQRDISTSSQNFDELDAMLPIHCVALNGASKVLQIFPANPEADMLTFAYHKNL